jgi:hypothetical protein
MESGIFLIRRCKVKTISLRLVFIIVGALLGGLTIYLIINRDFPMGVLAGFAAGAVIILLLACIKEKSEAPCPSISGYLSEWGKGTSLIPISLRFFLQHL